MNGSTLTQGPPPITVHRGPSWLARLYFNPPAWVNPSIKFFALLAVLVVAYRLYKWQGWIDLEVQHEMQIVVASLLGIYTVTLAMVNWTASSYLVDVVVGVGVGYGVVLLLQLDAFPLKRINPFEDRGELVTVSWLLLGVGWLILPSVAGLQGRGIQLPTMQYLLFIISLGMALYNVFWRQRPETQG